MKLIDDMKTIVELLIRLVELRNCEARLAHNRQLTEKEKSVVTCLQALVRDSLPAEVLPYYDELLETDPGLIQCPEIFAMSVLVKTYRQSSPVKRKKLVTFFKIPLRQVAPKITRGTTLRTRKGCLRQGNCRALAV